MRSRTSSAAVGIADTTGWRLVEVLALDWSWNGASGA